MVVRVHLSVPGRGCLHPCFPGSGWSSVAIRLLISDVRKRRSGPAVAPLSLTRIVTCESGGRAQSRFDTHCRKSGAGHTVEHGTRDELLGRLAESVESVALGHPTRVSCRRTARRRQDQPRRRAGRRPARPGPRLSSAPRFDDFVVPRAQRYRRGEYSAEGCYLDAHDHDALTRVLLDPLGPGGDGRFQPAVYDHIADSVLSPPVMTAPVNAVLVFDGVFLLRPELIDRWDLRIFVSTALDKTVDRAVIREGRVSSRADVERRWRERYIPSQQLYFARIRPTDHVDVVVHNDEPRLPAWETQAR
uniref:Nucleotide kinase n=1 Tax=Salinispora pacifica TaxID=351187 RepID=S4WDY5_SALPI|nr:nucleotide kinase [Salinispora pacifica]